MLEETYERSYNHNYMIIPAKEKEYSGFCEKIIQENEILGLLPCQFRVLEGKLFFYYEISGKRTLNQLFQKKKIGVQEMRRLLSGLSALQKESQRYLLDFQKYILKPEYLYSDFDIEHLYAVYYPDYLGKTALEEIGSFFIEHVDYQETEAVELAYSFQQRIMEENISLEFIVEELLKEKKKESFAETVPYEKKRDTETYSERIEKAVVSSVKEPVYTVSQKKKKQKMKDLICFSKVLDVLKGLAILKGLTIFQKDEKEDRKKGRQERIPYEVELDFDKNEEETPFFSETTSSEATQFFSSMEEQEVHALIYQGRRNLPNLDLDVFPYIIGKGERGIDGYLELPTISRIHSQLDYIDNCYSIMDLNSTNGTFVNGERLPPNVRKNLSEGDRIQFAGETYIFQ